MFLCVVNGWISMILVLIETLLQKNKKTKKNKDVCCGHMCYYWACSGTQFCLPCRIPPKEIACIMRTVFSSQSHPTVQKIIPFSNLSQKNPQQKEIIIIKKPIKITNNNKLLPRQTTESHASPAPQVILPRDASCKGPQSTEHADSVVAWGGG